MPPPRTPDEERLERVAAECETLLRDGAEAAIAEQAVAWVSQETWKALIQRHRRRGCEDLAELARNILRGSELLHAAVGRAVGGLLGLFGRTRVERVFAEEVARRVPLPVGLELAAAARALQIAGIYVCLTGGRGRSLADCACFRDVLRTEGQEQLGKLVEAATGDWRELPARVPALELGA